MICRKLAIQMVFLPVCNDSAIPTLVIFRRNIFLVVAQPVSLPTFSLTRRVRHRHRRRHQQRLARQLRRQRVTRRIASSSTTPAATTTGSTTASATSYTPYYSSSTTGPAPTPGATTTGPAPTPGATTTGSTTTPETSYTSYYSSSTPVATTTPAPTTTTQTPCADFTLGETAMLGQVDQGGNQNSILAQIETLTQPGVIVNLTIYIETASGHFVLGIYDATGPGGSPGILLAQTGITLAAVGWNVVPVLVPVPLAPGLYWLAFNSEDPVLGARYANPLSALNDVLWIQGIAFPLLPPNPGAFYGPTVPYPKAEYSYYATLQSLGCTTSTPSPTTTGTTTAPATSYTSYYSSSTTGPAPTPGATTTGPAPTPGATTTGSTTASATSYTPYYSSSSTTPAPTSTTGPAPTPGSTTAPCQPPCSPVNVDLGFGALFLTPTFANCSVQDQLISILPQGVVIEVPSYPEGICQVQGRGGLLYYCEQFTAAPFGYPCSCLDNCVCDYANAQPALLLFTHCQSSAIITPPTFTIPTLTFEPATTTGSTTAPATSYTSYYSSSSTTGPAPTPGATTTGSTTAPATSYTSYYSSSSTTGPAPTPGATTTGSTTAPATSYTSYYSSSTTPQSPATTTTPQPTTTSACPEGQLCIATGFISGVANCSSCVNGECVPHTLNPGIYPGDGDADGDFVPDACDNCPYVWNPSQIASTCTCGEPVYGYGPVSGLINNSNAFYVTTTNGGDNSILVDGACCGSIVANITDPNWTPGYTSIFTIQLNTTEFPVGDLCITVPSAQSPFSINGTYGLQLSYSYTFANDFNSHPIVPLNTPVCTNYTAGQTQIVLFVQPGAEVQFYANITCSSCLEGTSCTPQPGWLANCGTCIDGTCVANSLNPAIYPGDGDADGDFVPDACDNCPYVWNPSQNDSSCTCGEPVPGYGPVSGLINGSNAFYVTVPGTYVGPIADNSILVDGACCGTIVADILNPCGHLATRAFLLFD